jgi:two-component system response regulator FixJ
MAREVTVFVVDDNPEVRDSLKVLLATADIEVKSFASAEEFLAEGRPSHPYCILMDVRLPGMSGIDALKHLRRPGANAVVIVITGHGDVPMAVAAMRSGAYHFLEKPFDSEVLLDVIEEALSQTERLAGDHAMTEEAAECFQAHSPREKQVLDLLEEGFPSKVVAYKLNISTRTAEHHRAAVMKKMKARTLSHLVRMRLSIGTQSQH